MTDERECYYIDRLKAKDAELASLRAAAAPVVRWLHNSEQARARDRLRPLLDGRVIDVWAGGEIAEENDLTVGHVRALAQAMEPKGE